MTDLLTAEQVAALLKLNDETVRRHAAAGKIPAPVRVGGAVRWRAAEILAWIEAGCPDPWTWTYPAK